MELNMSHRSTSNYTVVSVFAFATLCVSLFFPCVTHAYVNPGSPTGYVNDFAHVLTKDQISVLEGELRAFEASTSNEITVATVQSLGGDYIENFAVNLFQDWKVGKKDKDNGVLLLVAIEDKKVRIEVGYGLEGALPDSVANSIIQNDILPYFKKGDYVSGIDTGVIDIMQVTQGEYQGIPPAQTSSDNGSNSFSTLIAFGIVFLSVFFQIVVAILGKSKSWWAGGVLGGVIGIIISFFVGFLFIGLGIIIMFVFLGLLFNFLPSREYTGRGAGVFGGGLGGGGGGGGSGGGF